MLCSLGSVCTTQNQRQRRKLNLQVFLCLATVHFHVTVFQVGIWQPASGLPLSLKGRKGRYKSTSALSAFLSLKERPALGWSQNPEREKCTQVYSFPSHSPLLPIIPLSSKGSVFYTRESLAAMGRRVTAPPLSLRNCLAEP